MTRDASYARVSSDRQEQEDTVQSQLAELRARTLEDGAIEPQEFVDEGFGREILARPALDRLRDLMEQGELDRVYVQSPDRLASGAKLVLLVEEFQKHGVEVVFLKGDVEDTPEGKLLLHVQGAVAEYERAKIEERTRRGKLYWARQGALVGGHAPYGYRFIRRTDNERARLEVDEDKASTVRGMYRWIADEELSLRAVAKRLTEYGLPTARGASYWRPTAVARIVENPVYKGIFYYQRYESVQPATRLTKDPYRQTKKTGRKLRPESDWIQIPVPVIVEESLWERAQLQLQANSVYSRRNNKRHSYLLRSLIRCSNCGSTYSGQATRGKRYYPGFPILAVFRLKEQPERDSGIIARSCKASQSPVYPTRDAILAVNHVSCPSLSSLGPRLWGESALKTSRLPGALSLLARSWLHSPSAWRRR